MSRDGRAPWWYSGEGDEPDPNARADVSSPDADGEADAQPDGTSSAMDWTALVAGATKMVDWATEKVMAPHAEHTDPAEHPDCVVCRTVTLIGDPVGLMGGGSRPDEEPEPEQTFGDRGEASGPVPASGAEPIRWIPIVESGN